MAQRSLPYYLATRPTAPVGQAARGTGRVISSLAPTVMPMVDEYLDDPEVAGALSSGAKEFVQALGGGDRMQMLAEKGGPMAARIAARAAPAFAAEGMAGLGELLGAPDDDADPAVRRANMMMGMRLPNQRASQVDPGSPWLNPEQDNSPPPMDPQAGAGGQVGGMVGGMLGVPGIGQVADMAQGIAMTPGKALSGFEGAGDRALDGLTSALARSARKGSPARDFAGMMSAIPGLGVPGALATGQQAMGGPARDVTNMMAAIPSMALPAGMMNRGMSPRIQGDPEVITAQRPGTPRPMPQPVAQAAPEPTLNAGAGIRPPMRRGASLVDALSDPLYGSAAGKGPTVNGAFYQRPDETRDMEPRSPGSRAQDVPVSSFAPPAAGRMPPPEARGMTNIDLMPVDERERQRRFGRRF